MSTFPQAHLSPLWYTAEHTFHLTVNLGVPQPGLELMTLRLQGEQHTKFKFKFHLLYWHMVYIFIHYNCNYNLPSNTQGLLVSKDWHNFISLNCSNVLILYHYTTLILYHYTTIHTFHCSTGKCRENEFIFYRLHIAHNTLSFF